ncbi:MAG: hypothetical protein A2521_05005 [Deltaproteobacteria bacterium RIFOXYD12_FULL_57_12]|nr:MAG: hypothetical protein A2521_05005 [Deltaproteobacteria bacterium RIFOXYD12_FULL_57_12]
MAGEKTTGKAALVSKQDGRKTGIVRAARDSGGLQNAESLLRRSNRALKTISGCNRALSRAGDEFELLRDVCRIIVEQGGYRLVWVGYAGQDRKKSVRPVAWFGYEEGYLQKAGIVWSDTVKGRGPTGTCIRTAAPVVARNIMADPAFAAWRVDAVKRGYGSSIALPLRVDGQTIGALNLYAAEPDAFDQEEESLLADLAADLAYGITALRAKESEGRALAALKESEARFRRLFNSSHDAVFVLRGVDDVGLGRILEVNDMACTDLGFRHGELLKKSFVDLAVGLKPVELAGLVGRLQTESSVLFETDLRSHSGRRIPHEIRIQKYELQGEAAVMAIARDISERRQSEKNLRQAQKMEALGTLAGGIAHDFNNILSAIFGFAELARLEVPRGGEAAKHLDEISNAGKRAADLVRQILTFSRQTEQQRTVLRVQPVIKESLKLLRGTLPTTIEIRQEIDNRCGAILADFTQIHQVIMNLCANSYHAMQAKGGVLTVGLREVEFTGGRRPGQRIKLPAGSYACLSVSDTGHGMDRAIQERIFEPYFTTKKHGVGTGLGLSTVLGIVTTHGGDVTVKSAPGKGARFDVYFPLINRPPAPVRAGLAEEFALPRLTGRVLFVDDEELVLNLAKKTLALTGCQMVGARDGLEALRLFEADPQGFDVVVTDQVMPQMTGTELAGRLLALRPDIPIILITGFGELVTAKQAKAIGIRAFMLKPFSATEIANAIARILGHSKGGGAR